MVWTCFKKGWQSLGENVLLWRLREPDKARTTWKQIVDKDMDDLYLKLSDAKDVM